MCVGGRCKYIFPLQGATGTWMEGGKGIFLFSITSTQCMMLSYPHIGEEFSSFVDGTVGSFCSELLSQWLDSSMLMHPATLSLRVSFEVVRKCDCLLKVVVIGDDVNAIAEEVSTMSSAYELVITAGGVGPTLDDVTMSGVAQAMGTSLARYEKNFV